MVNKVLSINQKEILKHIRNNPNITISELVKIIGVSHTAIQNNLNKIQDISSRENRSQNEKSNEQCA